MGLKEKAAKLKKKKTSSTTAPDAITPPAITNDSESNSFGTVAALIIGAIGLILYKGRKT